MFEVFSIILIQHWGISGAPSDGEQALLRDVVGQAIAQAPCLAWPMSNICLQEEMIHDPLKKLLLKFSVLGRFMENLLKPSMLQGSSACEPVPGLGAGFAATVLICVLLGRSSGGHWKWLWPAARGIRQLAAKCPSSFLPSLNHTGLEKRLQKRKSEFPPNHKNGGEISSHWKKIILLHRFCK